MKNKILLAIGIFVFMSNGLVKSQTYTFSASSKPYVDLTGGIPLIDSIWDDPELAIPIGFNFPFYDRTFQQLYLPSTFNLITLIEDLEAGVIGNIILFGADLIDRGYTSGNSLSPITYKTTGNAGSKVLTVEWENAGFFGDVLQFGTSTDFVNFQLKLYENGNMEYHYGPSNVTHAFEDYSASGPIIGVIESLDFLNDESLGDNILLGGNPSSPIVVNTYQETHLNGTIPSGTVYTFTRGTTATDDPSEKNAKTYYFPNPATGYILLRPELQNEVIPPVSIINNIGRVVRVDDQPGLIELYNLPGGMYQLVFHAAGKQIVERIMIQE